MEDMNNREISLNMSMLQLKNLIGWATFNAIIDIIVGALSCLGIITAAYGVPQIIAGVKLLNATEELRSYMETNDTQKISETFNKLYSYFKLNRIATIVKICFGILIMIAYIIIIAVMLSKAPDFMRDYGF
ncbi:MAG: DUF5362 domain-containing protein [Alicyclobacillus herbarius]|uniref:DUF5362 family protein n=1 Tax=Alicyclobacillus herbarius TaxID=122960 RepID=UPI0023522A41|nr:DUF5362 family protein [Alicyclobacillus herbarius]MCL6633595.1 DUF5362 domain-containing protein [Alicyclobacillus herbarius]